MCVARSKSSYLEVDAVSRRRVHAIGITFFALVTISALLSVIGVGVASTAHAPTWAFLLFYSCMSMIVPLGGSIGYLFYVYKPDDGDTTS